MAEKGRGLLLAQASELDIVKTFECGQCFRWNPDEEGVYSGVVRGHGAEIREEDGGVYIRSDAPPGLWRDYFDLDRDYCEISRGFRGSEYLENCVKYGMGIRILRQEPWEVLCSFIISQCNNIKRIKGIVERLCRSYGEEFEFDGRQLFSFPSPERLAGLSESDLAVLRCGYRAEYILTAARAVSEGSLDLDSLIHTDYLSAKNELLKLRGIGEKVANCVVLFGLRHMEAFPIDVWIRRALKEHFPPDFDPDSLGEYAGLAQQYIFYYARSGENQQ
ncbi:MAG: DNA-3-methyladenine glycosylase family protein [Candidatus Limivicinus sp.]|jgi:N-glycosylase/DNA lyase